MKKIIGLVAFSFLGFFILVGCSQAKTNQSSAIPEEAFVRGPETAKLKIEQFSDFFCPYCHQQAGVFYALQKKYPDQVQMTFRHFPLSAEPGVGTFPFHEASVCAASQGKFWDFHDFVFQMEKKMEADEVAREIGLDEKAFSTCMQNEDGRNKVLEDLANAQLRGVSGTPTFFINGEKIVGLRPFGYFAELIDPEYAEQVEALRREEREKIEKQIDFSDEARPVQGPEGAPVTIVEFSDLHCFFCQKLTPVMNELMQAYPGKIRRVWRHFPLPIHPRAPYAHVASECAHQQGKFWEFHNSVFADISQAVTPEDFKRIAGEIGLDMELFSACYENEETKKKIENDVLLGFSKGVASTPSLLINDDLMIGAQPLEKLKVAVDEKLSENSGKAE